MLSSSNSDSVVRAQPGACETSVTLLPSVTHTKQFATSPLAALVGATSARNSSILRPVARAALNCMQQTASFLGRTGVAGCRMGWRELGNKLEAFYIFRHADSILQFASGASLTPFPDSVARARGLEAFQSFWAMEGVGYYYARESDTAGARGRPFPSEAGRRLACSLVPLQAGAGLWLAESSLATNQDDARLIRAYLQWSEKGPQDVFSYVAYEALGLVVRNLCPRLIGPLDRRLAETSKELQGCFWHGVGRGTYFALTNFLPYQNETLRAFAECRELPPHELGRLNAVSGFAWALTLINLRHPEIVERFLWHFVPQLQEPEADAFSHGVLSALTVWLKSVPGERLAHDFCQHQPTSFAVRQLWDDYIATPALQLHAQYTGIESREVERLFRYQPQCHPSITLSSRA